MNLEQLKYPIGKFEAPETISEEILHSWISEILHFPEYVRAIAEQLSTEQLHWKYRPNGWNIKQVIHHCADSHSNAFIRFKLALTEENPTIKPYQEHLWAELADGLDDDISYSLLVLRGLHHKWCLVLHNLDENQWNRTYFHPENNKHFSLKEATGLYAWHCKHHLNHIKQALEYKNEFKE